MSRIFYDGLVLSQEIWDDDVIIRGSNNKIRGHNCKVYGHCNRIYGNNCYVEGHNNYNYGRNNTGVGYGNRNFTIEADPIPTKPKTTQLIVGEPSESGETEVIEPIISTPPKQEIIEQHNTHTLNFSCNTSKDTEQVICESTDIKNTKQINKVQIRNINSKVMEKMCKKLKVIVVDC